MEPESWPEGTSWEDRFGEPEDESQLSLWVWEDGYGFWDPENPHSPPVIIRSKLLN